LIEWGRKTCDCHFAGHDCEDATADTGFGRQAGIPRPHASTIIEASHRHDG
jgi:hypothetical protein